MLESKQEVTKVFKNDMGLHCLSILKRAFSNKKELLSRLLLGINSLLLEYTPF